MKKVFLFLVFLGMGIFVWQQYQKMYIQPLERYPLALGLPKEPLSALSWIAYKKGFYNDEGLDVTITPFMSGKKAVKNGLLINKIDAVTLSDVVIVMHSFEKNDFSLIATISSADNASRIIARTDRAVYRKEDLSGKHISTEEGSADHFFMYNFFLSHGISENDIKISFLNVEHLVEQFLLGQIDAFSSREPFITQAKNKLFDKAIIFQEPGIYIKSVSLVIKNTYLQTYPKAGKRMLQALLKAEVFARENIKEAQAIVAEALKISVKNMEEIWQDISLHILLDQFLLSSLEEEARWAIEYKLVDAKKIPNYLRIINADTLREINPSATQLITLPSE